MLSYRLGMVNDFHWEFKPVLSYSKPHTFFGEEKERKNAFNLSKPCSKRYATPETRNVLKKTNGVRLKKGENITQG